MDQTPDNQANRAAAPAAAEQPFGFWARVREHKIIQWAVAYLGAALALAQGQELVGGALDWPEIVGRILVIGLIVLFPVALTLAWYHGHRGLQRITAGELTIISLLLLIGAVFFTVAMRPTAGSVAEARVEGTTAAPTPSSATVPEPATQPTPLPNSVAVLPFDNLSPDENNAYFAAGLHDEVLGQLGKLRNLNVIARTSVMQYANAARPIQEIARELNVEAVMEGSVSYADGRVAIRAQLIDANNGVHLWAESYNRELADVFAIQADIAMNIANALQAEFSAEQQARIERVPTRSAEAYALFLQALAILRVIPNDARIVALLEQAIEVDPGFAAAHATLARHLSDTLTNTIYGAVGATGRAELEATIRRHASRALELDASQPRAHEALGNLALYNWRWSEAEAAYRRGLDASPVAGGVALYYGYLLSYTGRHDESIALSREMQRLDPENFFAGGLGYKLAMAGDYDAAADFWRRVVNSDSRFPLAHSWLAFTELARGNTAEAASELALVESLLGNNRPIVYLPELAYGFARAGRPAEARRLFDEIEAAAAAGAQVGAGAWAMAYLAVGDEAEALEWLEAGARSAANHEPDPGFVNLMNLSMNITNDPVLRQPEFVAVFARIRGD